MEELVGLFDPNLGDSKCEEIFNIDEFENFDFNENILPPILPPEQYYGSIEYKRQLIKPSRKG